MKFVSLVCCVASVAATVDWNTIFSKGNTSLLNALEARIINGQVAKPKLFPYQAGLLIHQGEDLAWCGGTLLSNNWVLTAAHCTQSYKITRIHVILGAFDLSVVSELGRQIIDVNRTNVIVHEEYDSYQNDISLIRLPYPVELDDYIQPAKLPTNRYSTYTGVYAVTSGWGRTSNSAPAPTNKLLWISVPILGNSICSGAYPTGTGTGSLIQISHICISTVGIKAVCNGDSGGPLVLAGSNTVIGITSFGPISGCENGWPSVFTRVSYYLDWISDHTGLNVTKSNNAVSSSLLRNGSHITTTLLVIIFLYKHLILLQLHS